jgi:hypothetical protein
MYAVRMILGLAFVLVQGFVLLWAALAAPVHATGASGDTRFTQVVVQEQALDPGCAVAVETRNGSIEVRYADRPAVRIVATKELHAKPGGLGRNAFADDAEAAAYLGQVWVEVLREADRIYIRSRFPEFKRNVHLGVSYVLEVPAETPLELGTVDGSVTLAAR